jgi:hypothetical protein
LKAQIIWAGVTGKPQWRESGTNAILKNRKGIGAFDTWKLNHFF